ncbi:hypothetical protein [Legionella sainthelensi]|uniref:hypothetical protein n=1 Tax=Legionella sainthelensi TaxID=28087 RepID=UPI00135C55BA|nr:hypothetical protein [Legionella sainthelensi]
MIKYFKNTVAVLMLLVYQSGFSVSALFFNVSATGEPANLSITLCLNGKGPISCQNYNVSALTLTLFTTVPQHTYPFAGIKINSSNYDLSGCTPNSSGYCLFTVSDKAAANIQITRKSNVPWYPSLEAFEHYNSGRSHVFPQAGFGGSLSGQNVVNTLYSSTSYPSGYNMSYLNSNYAFIYGGGYGDVPGSIGAYVARVNPLSLQPIWYNQLINTYENGEWDYPGSLGILNDGYLYVSYGYRLAKLDPETGRLVHLLVLPTGSGLPKNTSFNGFNATADGTIIMKSVYRQAGCTVQGPDALLNCPDPTDVPPSILISVNPQTMRVIDKITLPAPVGARPTVTQYKNKNYVYLLEATTAIRYIVEKGHFILDSSWSPGTITLPGQTLCTSFVVVNDWVVAQTNTLPSGTALSVISINQNNAAYRFSIQPFLGDPIPLEIREAFSSATSDKGQAISWAPMSVSGDPDTNLIYASDSLPGKIAAIKISDSGLAIVWTANQRTTEFTTLINPPESRVLVGTDIPHGEIPGNNHNDFAVWRNALTGNEIARSPLLPAMTQGTMIQPYYFGSMFFEGQSGSLIKLSPISTISKNG